MTHVKYLILGAGAAGLTFADMLLRKGEENFLILEKENEAGGLCRSKTVDGSPLDTGGGHFLDAGNLRASSFLFEYLPRDEWDSYTRDSRIDMGTCVIGSPIEANIWQMPDDMQVRYLRSISKAGCNTGVPCPNVFTEWISWKLGTRIAEDYMLPYNRKIFGNDLKNLGTYWLNKLPNVSYEETLKSCTDHRAYGRQPGHAAFYYPKKYGYGEVWLRIADKLKEKIIYNTAVSSLNTKERTVNDSFSADFIITTVPWTDITLIKDTDPSVTADIASLAHTSVVIDYKPERMDTAAQWIYYPDPALDYHRILVRHNFCPGSKGYWTETNLTRFNTDAASENSFINEYAYPLNTLDKPAIMNRLLSHMAEYNIFGLGRWGEWQHYNSDTVVVKAMELAERF